jgi:hypothetical protein
MKRFLLLFLACLLAACSSLIGPREVDVPLSRLQEGVARRFPLDQRYLGLLDVHAAHSALALRPESGRIALSFDVDITPVLGGGAWRGGVTLSGMPKIDTGARALMLSEPRVEDIRGDGMGEGLGPQVARVASFLAANFIGDVPAYRFRDSDFRYAGIAFSPVRIDTRADKLVVTFDPVK